MGNVDNMCARVCSKLEAGYFARVTYGEQRGLCGRISRVGNTLCYVSGIPIHGCCLIRIQKYEYYWYKVKQVGRAIIRGILVVPGAANVIWRIIFSQFGFVLALIVSGGLYLFSALLTAINDDRAEELEKPAIIVPSYNNEHWC